MKDFLEFLLFRMYHWRHFNGASGGSSEATKNNEPDKEEDKIADGNNKDAR